MKSLKTYLIVFAVISLGLHRAMAQVELHTYIDWLHEEVKAPKSITLLPGFDTEGGDFHAYIDEDIDYAYTLKAADANYIDVLEYRKAAVSSQIDGTYRNSAEVRESIQYFDGLGRPIQSINVAVGNDFGDLIQANFYDALGREPEVYMPYFREADSNHGSLTASGSVVAAQQAYFAADMTGRNFAATDHQFAKNTTTFDVLNRPTSVLGPGAAWANADKKTTITYGTNVADEVPYYVCGFAKDSNCDMDVLIEDYSYLFYQPSHYPASSLFKETVFDEQGNKTETFMDKAGNVVLKRAYVDASTPASTLYIYDLKTGLLKLVVPPKAYAALYNSVNGLISPLFPCDDFVKDLCFYYSYDQRGRMVMKQVPGADPVYMIYDTKDQLVATQDANQIANNKALFTKYDGLGRPVITGLMNAEMASGNSFASEKIKVRILNSSNAPEKYTGSGALYGYTNNQWPQTNLYGSEGSQYFSESDVLTVSYYDQYEFTSKTYVNPNANYFANYDPNVRGMQTGGKVRVLKPDAAVAAISKNMLESVIYYDHKGRVIQTVSDNIYGGIERISNQYDFEGKILRTYIKNTATGAETVEIRKRFEYDRSGRLIEVYNELVGHGGEVLTAAYEYDDFGVQVEKQLHGVNDDFVQSVDYQYNIRGWLTHINNPLNLVQTEDDQEDLFAMALEYESWTTVDQMFSFDGNEDYWEEQLVQYNGNISAISSITKNGDDVGFAYKYDGLNRLIKADVDDEFGTVDKIKYNTDDVGAFFSYDLNGNLKTIYRWISRENGDLIFDDIRYTYESTGVGGLAMTSNRLKQAYEVGDTNTGYQSSLSQGTVQFTYDANGNMISDLGKNITSISYNHLNLPQRVTFGDGNKVEYYYTASGSKVLKYSTSAGGTVDWYQNGIVYNTAKNLNYALTEEGRIIRKGTEYNHEYNLSDHLGNVRLSFNTAGEIIQSDDYTPFGLTFNSYSQAPENKYLYNGKELQDETGWYDYGARMMDPWLGRWHVIDNKAEKYFFTSPYTYAINNPIIVIDPDGNDIIVLNDSKAVYGMGHMGDLIRNDNDGWTFVNKGGRADSDGDGDQDGTILTGGKSTQTITTFKSLDEAMTSDKIQRFDRGFRIGTTADEDAESTTVAKESAESDYHLIFSNCADVATDALESVDKNGGTETKTTYYGATVKTKSVTPNGRYEDIVENNKGEEVEMPKKQDEQKQDEQ